MKLFYSPTSPYVRKVAAAAITLGLDQRIERIPTNAHESPAALVAANPLSKVPTLVTDDGTALFDSPVICEYLDEISDDITLFPPHGAARWRALRLQALGDGILDAAVLARMESQRPSEAARDAVIARQKGIIAHALDALEAEPPPVHLDIGAIAVACALGYLDLRFAEDAWRQNRPALAGWFEEISRHKGLAETAPAG
ncbi:MAG TPA: glutathione S-transferase N-terminal domain-containing protein [Acetobacteraceae bacterium]|nr:glutathione S-transferase N-terminal domain-containing protein [Acetobacteraceae bacterium]